LQIRREDEVCAMAWNERLRTRVKNTFFTTTTTTAGASGDYAANNNNNNNNNSSSSALLSGSARAGALSGGGGGTGSGRALSTAGGGGGGDEEVAASVAAAAAPVQYRLEAISRRPKLTWWRRLWTCSFGKDHHGGGGGGGGMSSGINPNQKLAMWLHWMFRVNFVFLFSVMCIMFFTLVIIFAGFITLGTYRIASHRTIRHVAFSCSWCCWWCLSL
jgi:hypothetical protein